MAKQELYPLTFTPILKERVWGGCRLLAAHGMEGAVAQPVGESWELVDLAEDQSVVQNGPWAGRTLSDVIAHQREALMGKVALDSGSFPLLVKYIDAAQTLSVQVHPDGQAAVRLGGRPKSEAWYILEAEPGAVIYRGLRPGVTREAFAAALAAGQIEALLQSIPATPGAMIPVPPGTVHAIGAGVLLAEIQQPSDTTYRVDDWGRLGLDGQPRQLHREQALASIHFDAVVPEVTFSGEVRLGVFKGQLCQISAHEQHDLFGEGPMVAVGLAGQGRIVDRSGHEVNCGAGKVVLLPHSCRQATLSTDASVKLLLVSFEP